MKNDQLVFLKHKERPKSYKGYDGKQTDEYIKYCPNCNKCYELSYRRTRRGYQVMYYDDFPRIGKKKEICYKCK